MDQLLNLKKIVSEKVPDCKVIVSTPTVRSDGKANYLMLIIEISLADSLESTQPTLNVDSTLIYVEIMSRRRSA